MDRKLHFCFVTPEYALHPPFGGIATHDRTMAQWLVRNGHTVHVICSTRKREPGVEQDGDVYVHYVGPRRIRPRRLLASLSKLPGLGQMKEAYYGWNLVENSLGVWQTIRQLEPQISFDVVQCADNRGLALWGVWPTKRHRCLLLRGHGTVRQIPSHLNAPGGRFRNLLEGVCAKRANFVLTVSQYLADLYQAEHGIPEERLGVLLQPYDLASEVCLDDIPPRNSENHIILYVGRVEPAYKGGDVLLEALHLVHQRVPSIQGRIVGAVLPEFEQEMRSSLEGNESWLSYFGPLSQREVFKQMLQSDLLILPSRNETAGRVLVEAQYCGLPQVASRSGGIPEFVKDGVTGLLVEPGDPHALADAIQRLCEAPEVRREMGRQSRKIARASVDIDSTMEIYVRVVQALVEGQDPRPALRGASRN